MIPSKFYILNIRLVIRAEPQNSSLEARDVNTHSIILILVSKESADQQLSNNTSFTNSESAVIYNKFVEFGEREKLKLHI